MNQKTISLIIAIVLISTAIYYLEGTKVKPVDFEDEIELQVTEAGSAQNPKDALYMRAPELRGIAGYINTDPDIKISDLKGKVVMIDFWTYSCINCIRTLPYLTGWDEKYKDKGLVIIGVHSPEFGFEKKYDNVVNAVERYNINYVVVQDNDKATWKSYKNRFWPHKYLIDSEGYIRYDHIGEGAYEETELMIQELLAEIGEDVEDVGLAEVEDRTPGLSRTPELYAGYGFALPRGQNIGNTGGLQKGTIVEYTLPSDIEKDIIYLTGTWQSNEDSLLVKGQEDASVILSFTASSVNIVADLADIPLELEIFIDGAYITEEQAGDDVQFLGEKAFAVVDEPRLYNVVSGEYGSYLLELRTSEGFSFNAFTFG